MATYSTRDLELIPLLSFSLVENYIKKHKKSSGSKCIDRGFKYFSENYIHGLSVLMKENKPMVTGRCYQSQRKNEIPSQMSIQFASVNKSNILLAGCNCTGGLTGACGHIVGLLYQLAKYKMLDAKALPDDIAKTSQPQTWHRPRGQKIQGKAVQDLSVSGHSVKKYIAPTGSIKSTLFNPIRGDGVNWKSLLHEFDSLQPGMLVIPALKLENVQTVTCKYGQVPKGSVLSYQQKLEENCSINDFDETYFPELPCQNVMINSVTTVLDNEKIVALDSLKLSTSEIVKFEEQTRLQSQTLCGTKLGNTG